MLKFIFSRVSIVLISVAIFAILLCCPIYVVQFVSAFILVSIVLGLLFLIIIL